MRESSDNETETSQQEEVNQNDNMQNSKEEQVQSSDAQSMQDTNENLNNKEEKKETPEENAKKEEVKKMFESMERKSNRHNYNDVGKHLNDLDEREVPDSVINSMIDKFFNQTFSKKSDLNKKQEAFQEDIGTIQWNITDLVKHKLTKNLNQMMYDKHGFKHESGKGENVPLSFYFDLSGSMDEYIRVLAAMALRMLKKDVRIIIGYNQNAYIKINSISKSCTAKQFQEIFNNLEKLIEEYIISHKKSYIDIYIKKLIKSTGLEIEELYGEDIDQYLIARNAEKVVIFSDFDPIEEVKKLSQKCAVYWFCFQEIWGKKQLDNFNGKFFKTNSERDIIKHLQNINNISYERKQRKLGEFGTMDYFGYENWDIKNRRDRNSNNPTIDNQDYRDNIMKSQSQNFWEIFEGDYR